MLIPVLIECFAVFIIVLPSDNQHLRNEMIKANILIILILSKASSQCVISYLMDLGEGKGVIKQGQVTSEKSSLSKRLVSLAFLFWPSFKEAVFQLLIRRVVLGAQV